MIRTLTRFAAILVLGLSAQGCISTAVGVTTAVVGTTAKVGAKAAGATARAVIPGDSRKDKDKRRDD